MIEITAKEFLELIPLINSEIEKTTSMYSDLCIKLNEFASSLNPDARSGTYSHHINSLVEYHMLKLQDDQLARMEKKIDVLKAIMQKLEEKMISNFDHKNNKNE